ncbi:ABC transporter substrate-binding protein [Acetobacteraceae bacterium KSS8]|uniref:ABC transporter substrate-binding protein n=1 Tax=Endosaccharibacter trunci TaxID=2812733 RepID=A0ABT1WA50_9PROT|nr:ABC transporter substrate-binding protein [Acetobacteraceae bacterium KSS8]
MMSPAFRSTAVCFGLAVSAALWPVAASAQIQPASEAAPSVAAGSPTAPVSALYAALGRVEHSSASFAERARMLAPSIDNAFDLQTVLQNSVGLRYRTIPEAQKAELLNQFRQFTVARYVSNFAPGGNDTFTVDPAATPAAIPGEQIVHTHITANGSTTDVNYVMRQTAAGWRVVDVLLNGNISQVAVQRADFSSGLSSGDASALIQSLKKKIAAFQGG